MIFSAPVTLRDALRNLSAKRVLELPFSSAEIAKNLPEEILARSMFSAHTTLGGYLQDSQALIARLLQPGVIRQDDGTLRPAGRGESLNPAKVRTLMQEHLRGLGYQPEEGEAGGLKDLSSDRRVSLVINMQTQFARGYARQRSVQSPTILSAFPADRLYRAIDRKERRSWHRVWNEARSTLGAATTATLAVDPDTGPFVALKNDPIWIGISDFDSPYPPFAYGSGMRVRSVSAREAEEYGITTVPEPQRDSLQDGLATPLRPNTPQRMIDALLKAFPGATIENGKLQWSGV